MFCGRPAECWRAVFKLESKSTTTDFYASSCAAYPRRLPKSMVLAIKFPGQTGLAHSQSHRRQFVQVTVGAAS
eukprot:9466258-Pyramimonas_sp.AAC.1